MKGVRDASGKLLSILSVYILATALFFLRVGEHLCRKLVVAIAV